MTEDTLFVVRIIKRSEVREMPGMAWDSKFTALEHCFALLSFIRTFKISKLI